MADASSSIAVTNSDTPGITNRKVKLKSNDPPTTQNFQEDENPDNWMKDLSVQEVMAIMDGKYQTD